MLLDEAKKVLAKAGYKMVSEQEEIKNSFRDFKKKLVTEAEDDYFGDDEYYEDGAEGAGIAYGDGADDGMECPVCAICGEESCDGEGEYTEDGDFVCAACAANTEQEMIDLDPGSFWDDKIPDARTPRARQLDDMADDEDYEEFEESLHSRKYGRKLYEALSDEDYIDPSETVEGGLSDDDYIDPETNLDDEPIEDYNGEEENICPSCGEPFTGEGYEDEDGNWYCSEDCYESAMQMAADDWLDAYKDRMYGESCECGKKGCCCGGKKSKKKGKKGKSNKGWVPFWQYKKGKKDED